MSAEEKAASWAALSPEEQARRKARQAFYAATHVSPEQQEENRRNHKKFLEEQKMWEAVSPHPRERMFERRARVEKQKEQA